MKIKLVNVLILVSCCLILFGCNKEVKMFLLDDKYYKESSIVDLNVKSFDKLIDNKESFALFVYQPLCTTSYEFEEVLSQFSKKYNISFYKMPYSNLKETKLGNKIKYYPTILIFEEGGLIDYLNPDSDEHIKYYKTVEGFKEWFSSYVVLKEENKNVMDNLDNKHEEKISEITAKLDKVKYNESKINIYFFWGKGCPHCEKEFEFFENIKNDYGEYFTLNTFEVWYDDDNANLLKQFAGCMGDEVTGVPYTIIGKKTFKGFSESYEDKFLKAIETQYKNSYDVYFENTKE